MKTGFLVPAFMLGLVMPARAQQAPKISAEGGGQDDRASARVLYWNDTANAAAGQFAIDYGRPVWKKQYDDPAAFDKMTTGKVWRMGSNFWTALYLGIVVSLAQRCVRLSKAFSDEVSTSTGRLVDAISKAAAMSMATIKRLVRGPGCPTAR